MGCAMKANLLAAWRQHFVLEEQMLEVDCSMLTPEHVLKASGHAERFADFMIKDLKSGECFRADHLIESTFEKMLSLPDKKTAPELKEEIRKVLPLVEGMSQEEMRETLRKYDMKSPSTGAELSDPMEFNLMFSTSIGPTGGLRGFLRPETAQGIFVNFKRLLEFNQGALPFAAAQIGNAFRNEISPRAGLIRVREFTMAEIEHFCDPDDKSHSKYDNIKGTEVTLYSACAQMSGGLPKKMTIGAAVEEGLICNETLAYYMARIYQFLIKVGVADVKLRFRQHMANEMAHYAKDCWDAECKTTYGWVECVGCADRSCYDLKAHEKATGVRLVAEKRLPEPKEKTFVNVVPNKQILGKSFKKEAKDVQEALTKLDEEAIMMLEAAVAEGAYSLAVGDKTFDITAAMVEIRRQTKKVHVEELTPSVVEPSFGIGRVMYAIFEHNFATRENDEQRTYLRLPPVIAPYKCSVLPLSRNAEFKPFVSELSRELTRVGVSHRVDGNTGSIGRRYARTDQIAVPYGVTIDFDTLSTNSATLRERDSMKQIRAPLADIPGLVYDLSADRQTWSEVLNSYPLFEQQEATK
jgi:glycyl-tRNA synthetase